MLLILIYLIEIHRCINLVFYLFIFINSNNLEALHLFIKHFCKLYK